MSFSLSRRESGQPRRSSGEYKGRGSEKRGSPIEALCGEAATLGPDDASSTQALSRVRSFELGLNMGRGAARKATRWSEGRTGIACPAEVVGLFAFVAGIAPFDLDTAAAGFQVARQLGLCSFADLDAIIDGGGTGRFAHARGGSFVLDDVGPSLDGGDAALDPDGEVVGVDLRLGELGPDGGFQLPVVQFWLDGCRPGRGGWDGALMDRRIRRT